MHLNERRFKKNVLWIMAVYAAALTSGIFVEVRGLPDGVLAFKDLIPLIIAIPAAWLGYCFQKRQAYLRDLRELWSKLVASVQDAIQYTYLPSPEQADFGRVLRALSIAIEELRGVFSNIGEAAAVAGVYPFDNIKLIYIKISNLGFGERFNPSEASRARCEIVDLWKELRRHYLNELERGLPAETESRFLQKVRGCRRRGRTASRQARRSLIGISSHMRRIASRLRCGGDVPPILDSTALRRLDATLRANV